MLAVLDGIGAAVLLIPRITIMTVAELVAFAGCAVAAAGADPTQPLTRWRRSVVEMVVPICCRVVLWTAGFWYLRVHGTASLVDRRSRETQAKIFISNHASILDGFVLTALLRAPSFVARAQGLKDLPMYSTILKSMQLLYVEKASGPSRHETSKRILERTSSAIRSDQACKQLIDSSWPPLVVFPEGTTNGGLADDLLEFKPGAFRPGLPVQPIVIRYPGRKLNKTSGDQQSLLGDILEIASLLMCVNHRCEVSFLPVYHPSSAEQEDPAVYASAVREHMQKYARDTATDR